MAHGFWLALLSALAFGASSPAAKTLLGTFTPQQLAGLLYLGAALGMMPSVARERRRAASPPLGRANALRLAGVVVFGGALAPVLLLLALARSAAGSVALLSTLEVAATAVLGALAFREHLGARGWLGAAGVALASGVIGASGGWPGATSAGLAAAACACWALDNQLAALIDGVSAPRVTLVKGAAAGSVNLALGIALAPLPLRAVPLAAALGLGALSYGASVLLYIRASHELGATRAQGVFATAPFLGAGLSFLLLGEPLGAAHLAAIALLVPSVAALAFSRHAHSHDHAALAHEHAHRHDDGHHDHAHAGLPPETRHAHLHRHGPQRHAHPHWPDLHHRHVHGQPPSRK